MSENNSNQDIDLMFHLKNQQPSKLLGCKMPNIQSMQDDFVKIISPSNGAPFTHFKNPETRAKITALLKTLRTVSVSGIQCLTSDLPQAKTTFCKKTLTTNGLNIAILNEIESLIDLYSGDIKETINWLSLISADSETFCNGDRRAALKLRLILSKVGNIFAMAPTECKVQENDNNKFYIVIFILVFIILLLLLLVGYFMFFRRK
jgi:hypothetical protein